MHASTMGPSRCNEGEAHESYCLCESSLRSCPRSLVLRIPRIHHRRYVAAQGWRRSTLHCHCSRSPLLVWPLVSLLLRACIVSACTTAAFLTQTIQLNDAIVKFEIWDTAGQVRTDTARSGEERSWSWSWSWSWTRRLWPCLRWPPIPARSPSQLLPRVACLCVCLMCRSLVGAISQSRTDVLPRFVNKHTSTILAAACSASFLPLFWISFWFCWLSFFSSDP